MIYTQSELYYYFKNKLPHNMSIKIKKDESISEVEKCFILEQSGCFIKMAELLSSFKYEIIKFFLENTKKEMEEDRLELLEKYSFNVISKLKIKEENNIPRVLIERNFNSKQK